MGSESYFKTERGLGPCDAIAGEVRTVVGQLEDLVDRMAKSLNESGAVSRKDAAQLRELRLKMERVVGRR